MPYCGHVPECIVAATYPHALLRLAAKHLHITLLPLNIHKQDNVEGTSCLAYAEHSCLQAQILGFRLDLSIVAVQVALAARTRRLTP
jgi:hypothetical protein